MNTGQFIIPQWPAPPGVLSAITTRVGGQSLAPYNGFNLGDHVGDETLAVQNNRKTLVDFVKSPVAWLQQTHGINVVDFKKNKRHHCCADASTTCEANLVCAVLTADCLPILLTDTSGKRIAAVHAGWRGLANGIIAETLAYFDASPEHLLAYLGPAISAKNFEVGEDVLLAFQQASSKRRYARPVDEAFKTIRCDKAVKYMADLYQLARYELEAKGVEQIYGGQYCTYEDDRFFSYRKEGVTGRIATLIWKTS